MSKFYVQVTTRVMQNFLPLSDKIVDEALAKKAAESYLRQNEGVTSVEVFQSLGTVSRVTEERWNVYDRSNEASVQNQGN